MRQQTLPSLVHVMVSMMFIHSVLGEGEYIRIFLIMCLVWVANYISLIT